MYYNEVAIFAGVITSCETIQYDIFDIILESFLSEKKIGNICSNDVKYSSTNDVKSSTHLKQSTSADEI